MAETWWKQVGKTDSLAQGELLSGMDIFSYDEMTESDEIQVEKHRGDFLLITQSCDLENNKVPFVSMCSIMRVDQYLERGIKSGESPKKLLEDLETFRKGKSHRMHILSGLEVFEDSRLAYVVDFVSLCC